MSPARRSARIVMSALLVSLLSAQTPYDSLHLKSTVYRSLTAHFALSKLRSADIVFLGNSITAGGNWAELLGRERVVNRGIGGDNTVGMLHRLSFVVRLRPKLCFIMAGINDLYADAPVDRVFRNYQMIVDSLVREGITPVIQSTLHVHPRWKRAEVKNLEVAALNVLLKQLARSGGWEYIDINAVLSEDGILKEEFTTDGVHLTPAAYERWRDLLEPVIVRNGF